jgi:hypothetical protein
VLAAEPMFLKGEAVRPGFLRRACSNDSPSRKAVNEGATQPKEAAMSPSERNALFTDFVAYRKTVRPILIVWSATMRESFPNFLQ